MGCPGSVQRYSYSDLLFLALCLVLLDGKKTESSLPLDTGGLREPLDAHARRWASLELLVGPCQFEVGLGGHTDDGIAIAHLAQIRARGVLLDLRCLGQQIGRDGLFLLYEVCISGVQALAPGLLVDMQTTRLLLSVGVTMCAEKCSSGTIMNVRRLCETLFCNDGLLLLQLCIGIHQARLTLLGETRSTLLRRLTLPFQHQDAARNDCACNPLVDAQRSCDLFKGVFVLVVFTKAKAQLQCAPLLFWQCVKELLDLLPLRRCFLWRERGSGSNRLERITKA